MRRTSCSLALLLSISLGASAIANQSSPGTTPVAIEANALGRKPQSVAEGREALDSAVAAAVVGALSEQFTGHVVSIKLGDIDVQPSSIRDRTVSGEGQLQIGAQEEWIGFRFRTLYDTSVGTASYPDITLGGAGGNGREVPNDAALVRQLDARLIGLLGEEFGNQAVRLQLDRITTVEAGKRYLRIDGSGIADFGREGATPAQVNALYDRQANAWLRVDYELGSTANRDVDTAVADGP